MSSEPQSKPIGDEDAIGTFSLAERRALQADPALDFEREERALTRRIEAVVEDIFGGQVERPDTSNAQAEIREALGEIRAALAEVAELKARQSDAPPAPSPQPVDAPPAPSPQPLDEPQPEPPPRQADFNEPFRADQRGNRIPIDRGDAEEGAEDTPPKTSETSDDGKAVALDVIGQIYLPGIAPFEIWDLIAQNRNWNGLSLKATVSSLQITSTEFVNEFNPGALQDMVVFEGDPPAQTEFTWPLAQRIDGNGNSWLPCTQGGVYVLNVFCVNGSPAIFPIKST